MAKMIFVNLPVSDLARSTAFYQAIGAEKNPQFSDDTASCMVISDTIHAMLLTHDKYRQFTSKKIADAKTSSQVLICLSADSRDAVDDMVGKAQGAGGGADPGPKQDYGFMYGRSFEDPDGHHWEVMWMDVAAATACTVRHGRRLIDQAHQQPEYAPCPRFPPACGSTARPRRPRSSTFHCCPIPGSRMIQRNTVDGPAGKAGTVLVVEFTLAGQRFMALNGGMQIRIHPRRLVQDRLRRSGRGRSALGCAAGGRRQGRTMRLAEGPLRRIVADRADRVAKISRRRGCRRRAARDAGDDGDGQARHRRTEARV